MAKNTRVFRSDSEWRKILAPEQFRILRESGTERPGTGPHLHENREGTYCCAGCGEPLYRSETKFEAHCGWPSFYAPAAEEAVEEHEDNSYFMRRTEIRCAGCDGHLGHVFEDGPPPTGLRYCINGHALVFHPDAEA